MNTFCNISAPGNVMDHVIIERASESTIVFVEGARDAYLGYVTLKVSCVTFLLHLCPNFEVSGYCTYCDNLW